ncbi:polyhydroxyalkanoic acid synthase subunit PhaR [Schinkia sp. CFF1]
MSTQNTYDPFVLWQDYYKNVQNYWGPSINEKVGTEEFSEWMGKVLEGNLLFRQMTDKNTKQYLEQMNLPSREDLSNLSSLIINLDKKVDDMEEQLEETVDNLVTTEGMKKEMASLKKEVKDLGSKLDEVLQFLKEEQQKNNNNIKNVKANAK